MVPAYIQQWLYTQLEQLHYSNTRLCFTDLCRALDDAPWLKPKADMLQATGSHLISLQGKNGLHNVEIWVSAGYPTDSSFVYVDSQQRQTAPGMSLSDLLHTSMLPPPLPSKPSKPAVPSKPPKLPAKAAEDPSQRPSQSPAPPPKAPKVPLNGPPAASEGSVSGYSSRAASLSSPRLPPKHGDSSIPSVLPAQPVQRALSETPVLGAYPQNNPAFYARPYAPQATSQTQYSQYGQPPTHTQPLSHRDPQLSPPATHTPVHDGHASVGPSVFQPNARSESPRFSPNTKQDSASPRPAVDLLDSTDTPLMTMSSQRAQTLAKLESQLRMQAAKLKTQSDIDAQQLMASSRALAQVEFNMTRERDALIRLKDALLRNIDVLEKSSEKAQHIVNRSSEYPRPDSIADLVSVATSDRAVVEADAGSQAIDDLLRILPKALDAGTISLHVYLRLVRQYAREQFLHRHALLQRRRQPPNPPAKH